MTAPELERGKMTAPELERGKRTAPELDRGIDEESDSDARGIVCVGPDKGVDPVDEGVGGKGEVGGGVSDDVEVDAEIGLEEPALVGKYEGFGGRSGGLSTAGDASG
jgi:hypothetical protein